MKQWKNHSAFGKVKTGMESLAADTAAILDEVLSADSDAALAAGKVSIGVEKMAHVTGVLKTLDYSEFSLLTNELCGHLADSINAKKAYSAGERAEAWKLAYLTLTDFPATLEGILSGQINDWHEYSLLINKLRKARNLSLAFGSKVLTTNTNLQFGTLFVTMPSNMAELAGKQIDKYRTALELYQLNGNIVQLTTMLRSVFGNLEVMHRDFRMGTLWGLCLGLVDTLPDDADESPPSATLELLRSFTTIMTQLKEMGVQALSQNIPEKVLEKILDVIAAAPVKTSRLKSICLWYNLKLGYSRDFRKANKAILVGFSRKGASIKAARFLTEEINALYDAINNESAVQVLNPERLQHYMQALSRISSTFHMLSMAHQADEIDACLTQFRQYQQNLGHASSEDTGRLLSRTVQNLYLAEIALLSRSQQLGRAIANPTIANGDILAGPKLSLVAAALKNFDSVLLTLDSYVESGCDTGLLRNTVTPLQEIQIALNSIPLRRAASFINGALQYIDKLLDFGVFKVLTVESTLKDLAHLLLNTRSYLEQLSNDRTTNFQWTLDPNERFLKNMEGLSADSFADIRVVQLDTAESAAALAAGESMAVAGADEQNSEGVIDLQMALESIIEAAADSAESVVANVVEAVTVESDAPASSTVTSNEMTHADEAGTAPVVAQLASVETVIGQGETASIAETAVTETVSPIPMSFTAEVDDDEDDDLKAIFTEEAEGLLQDQSGYFQALGANIHDNEALVDLRRSFHTLKGSGRMVEARAIGELAWSAENLLNSVIAGRVTLDAPMLAMLRRVHDAVPGMIVDFKADEPCAFDANSVGGFVAEVNQFLRPGAAPVAPPVATVETQTPAAVGEQNRIAVVEENLDAVVEETSALVAEEVTEPAAEVAEEATIAPVIEENIAPVIEENIASVVEENIAPLVEENPSLITEDVAAPVEESLVQQQFATVLEEATVPGEAFSAAVVEQAQPEAVPYMAEPAYSNEPVITEQMPESVSIDAEVISGASVEANATVEIADASNVVDEQQILEPLPAEQVVEPIESSIDNLGAVPEISSTAEVVAEYVAIIDAASELAATADAVSESTPSAEVDMPVEVAAQAQAPAMGDTIAESEVPFSDAVVAEIETPVVATIETVADATFEVSSEIGIEAGVNDNTVSEEAQTESELFDVFVAEVSRQIGRIREYLNNPYMLDDNGYSVTTTSFLIPVHTLYGSCRMARFDEFGHLVAPLERLLQSHPYQSVNTNVRLLLIQFCQIAEQISEHVAMRRVVSLQDVPGDQLANLRSMIEDAEAELAGPRCLDVDTTAAVEATAVTVSSDYAAEPVEAVAGSDAVVETVEQDEETLVLRGFLQEAQTTVALLQQIFTGFRGDPGNQHNVAQLQQQLGHLEGAATLANEHSVADMSRALALAYQQYCRQLYHMSPAILEALGQGHDYLSQALQALQQGIVINDSAPLAKLLQSLVETQISNKAKNEQSESEQQVEEALLEVFLVEADEILREIDKRLADWQQVPGDQSVANDLLRLLHTLKGSAALVGESEISEQAHAFESFIIASTGTPTACNAEFFENMHARLDTLQSLYAQHGRAERDQVSESLVVLPDQNTVSTEASAAVENTADETQTATRNGQVFYIRPDAVPEPKEAATEPGAENHAVVDDHIRVSGNLLRSLLNDADEINIARNRVEQNLSDLRFVLNDMDETLGRLKGYIQKFEAQTKQNRSNLLAGTAPQPGTGDNAQSDFDALEMDRYTEFQQIALSLLEDYDDLGEIRKTLAGKLKVVDGILGQQQRFTNRLQDGLISSQMVPFAGMVPRLRRLTRQVSAELGKQVAIKFSNPEGRMDRSILQSLYGPLEHMIRNAIDHGIESPAERLQKGKPEQGTILVKLYRQGASINLDVSDDGRGIDQESVRRKGVSLGLVEEGAALSEQAAYQLIFAPGFSTASGLSKISGRGVGLDVVHNEITQIGGDIDVFSKPSEGTTFKFRLPLTASLNRALLFTLDGTQYVMLLNTIDGIMLETVDNLRHYATLKETTRLRYSGRSYDLAYLGQLLDGSDRTSYAEGAHSVPVLLIGGNNRRMALQVDAIIGSRELVVKPLPTQFSHISGVSGVVILGDGTVVPVLDPVALVDEYAQQDNSAAPQAAAPVSSSEQEIHDKTVLVVDDSITVRKVTSAILKRNGMKVLVAKNGVEALEVLQHTVPDVMLLDIEMPKMDGFEVAAWVRRQQGAVQQLPIIMITSRIGDKHRRRATEIGVNEYMCKPFQEENLLEQIARFKSPVSARQIIG